MGLAEDWGEVRTMLRMLGGEAVRRLRPLVDQPLDYVPRQSGKLTVAPPDILPGDPAVAEAIYEGTYPIAGHTVVTNGRSPLAIEDAPLAWRQGLHGFGWLRHARAADTALARAHARALTTDWIAMHGRGGGGVAWSPIVAATRLRHWLSHSRVLLGHDDEAFLQAFLPQVAAHHRFVRRAMHEARDPVVRLRLLATLCLVAFSLETSARERRRLNARLADELQRQILPDGGHVSRRAEALLDIVDDLLPLRQCHVAEGRVAPRALLVALDRMLPALRFHTHADGTLAMHNGTREVRRDRLAALLALDPSGEPGRMVAGATAREGSGGIALQEREAGYQRLAIGDTVVIADTGRVPPPEHAARAHLGTLSFEMSSGAGEEAVRIVTGLGHARMDRPELARALRGTAAHSTLAVDGVVPGWIATSGLRARLLGETLMGGPERIDLRRADAEDGSWRGFRATHDGFAHADAAGGGALHERILTLTEGGASLRGQDALLAPEGASEGWRAPGATIRFHLYPDIAVSRDGDEVRLTPTMGAAWRFRIEPESAGPGLELAVEDSLYAGGEVSRPTRQIVLRTSQGRARVAWTFSREARAER